MNNLNREIAAIIERDLDNAREKIKNDPNHGELKHPPKKLSWIKRVKNLILNINWIRINNIR